MVAHMAAVVELVVYAGDHKKQVETAEMVQFVLFGLVEPEERRHSHQLT